MKNILRITVATLLCLTPLAGWAQTSPLIIVLSGVGGPGTPGYDVVPQIDSTPPGGTTIGTTPGSFAPSAISGEVQLNPALFHAMQAMGGTSLSVDGGNASGLMSGVMSSKDDFARAQTWNHIKVFAGGFWGPNGVSGSDGALNMIGNITLGLLGRTGWSNWWQETGCQSGRVCVAMATPGMAEGELPIRGSALRASGEFSPDFDHIFNTETTFIRSDGNPLPGIFSGQHLISRPQGARAGVELYSEYFGNMDGTGMWRYSNHVGVQNSTQWFLDDMSGFDLDPVSGLWINKNPVLGFTRYRDMNLFFPPRSR